MATKRGSALFLVQETALRGRGFWLCAPFGIGQYSRSSPVGYGQENHLSSLLAMPNVYPGTPPRSGREILDEFAGRRVAREYQWSLAPQST